MFLWTGCCLPQSNPIWPAIGRRNLCRVSRFRKIMKVEYHRLIVVLLKGIEHYLFLWSLSTKKKNCRHLQVRIRPSAETTLASLFTLGSVASMGIKVMFGVQPAWSMVFYFVKEIFTSYYLEFSCSLLFPILLELFVKIDIWTNVIRCAVLFNNNK